MIEPISSLEEFRGQFTDNEQIDLEEEGFQVYRKNHVSREAGPLFLHEQKVFLKVFSMLAKSSLASLMWNSSTLNGLQKDVQHIHPFNFLEAVVHHPPLKKDFLSVVERGGMIWSQCFSRFKENLELQDSMGNVAPYVEDFSRRVQLDEVVVKEILSKDTLLPADIKSIILNLPEDIDIEPKQSLKV